MKDKVREALNALMQALEEDEAEDAKSMEEVVEEAKEEVKVDEGEGLEVVRTETRTEKFNPETGDGEVETKITFKDGMYYGI